MGKFLRLTCLVLLALSPLVRAQATEEGVTAAPSEPVQADLVKAAQNPIANMVSLPIQFNAGFATGPHQATTGLLNLQPVIPFPGEDWTLVNRAIIPLSYLPDRALPGLAQRGAELGFGDLNNSLFFTPTQAGEIIWGAGPTFTVPTATSTRLGAGKWLAGPTFVTLTNQGPWTLGFLTSQQWTLGGDASRPDVSLFTLQPFVNYNFDGGWYLTTSPVMTSNWLAPSGERWTVPLGGGFGRVFKLGDQPVNISLQGFKNVVSPSLGPEWSVRFQFTLLNL